MVSLFQDDFQTSITKFVGVCKNSSKYSDVTLISDDYQLLPAHKFLLSSNSIFFRDVFDVTTDFKPVIFMHGIGAGVLNQILDYLYLGEVKIKQDSINAFMEAANKLKIVTLEQN